MTNNPRIYLWIALALMVWLNYDAWQRDYGPRPDVITNITHPANSSPAAAASSDLANQIPQIPKETSPAAGTPAAAASAPTTLCLAQRQLPHPDEASSPLVHVRTDVLDLDISTRGGTIQRADLVELSEGQGRSDSSPPRESGRSADSVSVAIRD